MKPDLITAAEALLKPYLDAYLQLDYLTLGWLKLAFELDTLQLTLQLGYPMASQTARLRAELSALLQPLAVKVEIIISTRIQARAVQPGVGSIPGVKNIIAVASGKGGVGKSTVAVNLALALCSEGAQVGILDADIYGPSQPQMLGIHRQPDSHDGTSMEPLMAHGLQVMSIGFLVALDTPIIWRGPMVSRWLQQLLNDTRWRNLDYLILDLPPGTGDIQLTMAQKIPVSGGVIVTTPQNIALQDAQRGLQMLRSVKIPVIGVIENMSHYVCSACGHSEAIFDSGGGQRFATQYTVPLLGQLPLHTKIRAHADSGNPTVVAEPESQLAKLYSDIARRIAAKLTLQPRNLTSRLPKIVVETQA